jgi:hypothetical protein
MEYTYYREHILWSTRTIENTKYIEHILGHLPPTPQPGLSESCREPILQIIMFFFLIIMHYNVIFIPSPAEGPAWE